MSDESDIELKSAIPKKWNKKMPASPSEGLLKFEEPKKFTTKEMVRKALTDLKTGRKGVSLKAIKKYIQEKFFVDVERNNYIIKKIIKSSVENGSIIQTKGIGASGSFRLAVVKDKIEKKKQIKKKTEKPLKQDKTAKTSDSKEKSTKTKKDTKVSKNKKKDISKPVDKPKKTTKTAAEESRNTKSSNRISSENAGKVKKVKVNEKSVKKMAKSVKTPTKKRTAMLKRKSIGSLRKPPKMKPTKS